MSHAGFSPLDKASISAFSVRQPTLRRAENNTISQSKVKGIGIDHAICFYYNRLILLTIYKLEF